MKIYNYFAPPQLSSSNFMLTLLFIKKQDLALNQ